MRLDSERASPSTSRFSARARLVRATYRAIAHVVKTHGRRGEVVAVSADGLPSLIKKGMLLAFIPPELRQDRWVKVRSCNTGDSGMLVSFEGIDDLSSASTLVGKVLLADESELPDDLYLHDPYALIGMRVADVVAGDLGEIVETLVGPANDVWVVEGDFGEVMIPVVEEFLVDLPEDGPFLVNLPAGLVEGIDGEGK